MRAGHHDRQVAVGVFRALVELHRSEGLSFRNVVVFSLDEFFPITPEELQSRNYSIHESLLDLVDIAPENIHIPDGTLPQDEVAAFCREYESKIEEYDGIDLMILGTGVQGQIGFNEPGSYTNTRTRLVALGNESRKSAASIFYGIDYVPHKAITMGLGTILGAKRIILIAWGEEKAQVIKDTVEGEKQLIVPATCLQDHPNVEVVVDEGASSQLTRVKTPWLVGRCLWPSRFIRTAVLWLCEQVRKPILKLTYQTTSTTGSDSCSKSRAWPTTKSTYRYSTTCSTRSRVGRAASRTPTTRPVPSGPSLTPSAW